MLFSQFLTSILNFSIYLYNIIFISWRAIFLFTSKRHKCCIHIIFFNFSLFLFTSKRHKCCIHIIFLNFSLFLFCYFNLWSSPKRYNWSLNTLFVIDLFFQIFITISCCFIRYNILTTSWRLNFILWLC